MFWGLIMEPQRRYTQTVSKSFHVSMAALDLTSSDEEPTQVICGFEDRNYLLCTLRKNDILQVPLDLNFEAGDKISFATNGKSHVHLTGFLNDDDDVEDEQEDEEEVNIKKRLRKESDSSPPQKKSKTQELLEAINSVDEEDSSDDSDVNFSELAAEEEEDDSSAMEEGEEEEDENEDVDEEDEENEAEESDEEDDEVEEKKKVKKIKENGIPLKKEGKKQKNEKQQQQKEKQIKNLKNDKSLTKESPKKWEKTPGKPGKEGGTEASTPQKKTIEGGVIIEDIKLGNGPVAKSGKLVQVYYEGRFKQNNKMFDSTTKGNGFRFRLGKQEVIKGWDVGVSGMKVGGKRRITCPPNMAYGQKGSPPTIPPNSTLVFEVELKNVN